MPDYDVIVVGSGFGGAVTACRLAEAGARVLVLERGRRWTPETYPRTLTDPWFFDDRRPDKASGWLDLRFFPGMTVAQGAGVGGGSLSYASVVMPADAERFATGWPREITAEAMRPHYARASATLGAATLPEGQETDRAAILRRAAAKLGYEDRYERVPLAIAFDPDFTYDRPDPIDARHAKPFTNAQGVAQATCAHLGNCHIGCDVKAKNTLDFNYLAAAEAKGAEIRPLHAVRRLAPADTGWRVEWERVGGDGEDGLVPGAATADRVVLAAGSLGSTELLLRGRDRHGTLPRVSARLGHGWSPNANFMTPAFYPEAVAVNQGIGPLIASGLSFMDGAVDGQRFYVEDDGFPNLLLNALAARLGNGWLARVFRDRLERGLDEFNPTDRVMLWLGEGVDAGDGRLRLGRARLAPWREALKLDWDPGPSRAVFDAIVETHRRLSEVEGGRAKPPPFWRWFKWLTSVHPLGGCAMADSAEAGVVDHRGEVFGHPGLYVVDGATIPRPIGRNPALTIAALAERAAGLMVEETRP
ncbi:MAG: GMC family oxidoreductase [Azospirillaceae bacterium]